MRRYGWEDEVAADEEVVDDKETVEDEGEMRQDELLGRQTLVENGLGDAVAV
jgi:hypothetical protein